MPSPSFRRDPYIERIASRMHVGSSYLAVSRYVISRLQDKRKTFLSLSRAKRRAFLREIFRVHTANHKLYRFVTGAMR